MSQAKISQQNKNKLTLNNKGKNFSRAHKLLGVTCFCACGIFSPKKINRLEIVLITSIYYTTNNNSFMTKNLRKAIMHRSKYKNRLDKCRTYENWCNYKTQQNYCVSLLKKTKQ